MDPTALTSILLLYHRGIGGATNNTSELKNIFLYCIMKLLAVSPILQVLSQSFSCHITKVLAMHKHFVS